MCLLFCRRKTLVWLVFRREMAIPLQPCSHVMQLWGLTAHCGFRCSLPPMMSWVYLYPLPLWGKRTPKKIQIQNHIKTPFLTKSIEPMEKHVQRKWPQTGTVSTICRRKLNSDVCTGAEKTSAKLLFLPPELLWNQNQTSLFLALKGLNEDHLCTSLVIPLRWGWPSVVQYQYASHLPLGKGEQSLGTCLGFWCGIYHHSKQR